MSSQCQTVLLVDNDHALLGSLRQLFENDGYTILTATSGEDALNVYQQHREQIDVLVTDVAVGLMNGFDLAIAVATAPSPVTVVFTVPPPSSLHNSTCDVCRTAAAHFVSKPFLYSQLRSKFMQLSAKTEEVTLGEWLSHCYDAPVKCSTQPNGHWEEETEKVHRITVQLQAVDRDDALLVRGLLSQPDGTQCACLIEPQIQTLRAWRTLRLQDFKNEGEPVVRLLARPAPGEQLERIPRRKRPRSIARSPSPSIPLESSQEESQDLTPPEQLAKENLVLSPAVSCERQGIVPLRQMEKEAIVLALRIMNGNKVDAALKLGIGLTTIYRKMQEYGIVVETTPVFRVLCCDSGSGP